jgi:hypothetical protein
MNVRSGEERRKEPRRIMDFERCPKYEKHELTMEQIERIAEYAADKAVKKIEMKNDAELANMVRKLGLSWGEKIIFFVGIIFLSLIIWATEHGFKI